MINEESQQPSGSQPVSGSEYEVGLDQDEAEPSQSYISGSGSGEYGSQSYYEESEPVGEGLEGKVTDKGEGPENKVTEKGEMLANTDGNQLKTEGELLQDDVEAPYVDPNAPIDFASVAMQLRQNEDLVKKMKADKDKGTGKFQVHGREVLYDRRSLFILDQSFCLRKALVWLIEWRWFDNFITFIILSNSVMLAMTDYNERIYGVDYVSVINLKLGYVDLAFTSIFIGECVFKITGMGFVWHRNSYLRDVWNWLDFFVVCISIVNFIPNVNSGGLKALRTFRILRPLRTINAIPLMKQQIQSLMTALPGLGNVLTFLIFVYAIFAIFAVQSFAGNQYQFCRSQLEPDIVRHENGTLISFDWPIVDTFSWLCTNDKSCEKLIKEFGPKDLEIYKCGASYEYNITAGGKMRIDNTIENEQILYDIVNFNHMGLAFLSIFQCLTMESWTTMMYNYMDSNNVYMAIFFFVFMILFGSFFTMQLVLAEIIESYERETARKEQEMIDNQLEAEKQLRIEEAKKKQEELELLRADPNYVEPEVVEQGAETARAMVEDGDVKKVEFEEEVLDDSAWEDEIESERDSRRRSHEKKCFRFFYMLVINAWFQFFIFLMILVNTVSLAADDYPSSNLKDDIISYCNQYFTWLFTIEAISKLIGLGPKNYKKDIYNLFDGFIVCVSLVDWTIGTFVGDNLGPAGSVLQALRAMRLLRIIKLARKWTALQEILGKIFDSLSDIGVYCMLLLLFMYIFALLGMQFFAKRAVTDIDGVAVPNDEILERFQSGEPLISARTNFDNIGFSLTTVFCVIFAEDWNWSMYKNILAFGTQLHYYAMYFIAVFAFGNYVLFALFTAILLSHFDSEASEEDEEDDGKSTTASEAAKPNICKRIFSKETLIAIKAEFYSMFGARPLAKKPNDQIEEIDLGEFDQEPNEFGEPAEPENEKKGKLKPNPIKKGFSESSKSSKSSDKGSEYSESEEEEGEKAEGLLTTKLSRSTSVLLRHYSVDPEDASIVQIDYSDVKGSAFFCFKPENKCRRFIATVEKGKPFNNVILLLIVISTINLAIETPLDEPGNMKLTVLQYIDYFMTFMFTCEMLIKWFTYGFAFTGKFAYLKQGWNCLDFVIVMSALFGLNPNATKSLKSLKTLRILRVLRPLKLASKNKGLKVAITALFKSLPAIGNLQLIIVFFLFLFGILHTTLLAGQFWSCQFDHVSLSYEQGMELIKTDKDCFNYGGEWVNNEFNFDTTLRSILTLFCLQSTEGWVDNMWAEVDTTERYGQPKMNNKPFYIIFGIFIEILINLLFLNLFVGVVIETFNQEKEKINKNNLLVYQQKSWISVQLMGYQAQPVFKQQYVGSFMRDLMIKVQEHWIFDSFIMFCIIANTFILMLKWYAMPNSVIDGITKINYGFMAIFTIEAVIKLFALRKNYFKTAWNIFDFTVVIGTLVILVVGFLNLGEFGIQSTILRSLRIGRVMRLLRRLKKLQIIFNTLMEALPSMGSLGMLLLLLMFMYAIIGMSQFGFVNTTDQENADYHSNFKNFLNSFLLLFRSATGEAWDSLMFDFGRGNSITFQCVAEMEYEQFAANGFVTNKCGSKVVAYVFFVSFICLCVQVFLNLFVAVIVDSFANQAMKAELPVQAIDVEIFCETWRDYDGEAKGFIPTNQIEEFIIQLAGNSNCALVMFPTRIKSRDPKKAHFRRKYIADLDIPTFKNFKQLMFYDVLLAIIKEKAKWVFNQNAINIRRNRDMEILARKKANNEGLTLEQIEQQCNKKYKLEFDGNFDNVIESFTTLDYSIDLINEVRNKSAFVTKQFKLNKEKADEGCDSETGVQWYYTTKMYIYGTFVTQVFRQSMANKKAVEAAAYGEIINGKRKIMKRAQIAIPVPKRSYLPPKRPVIKLYNEPIEEAGNHLVEDEPDTKQKKIERNPAGPNPLELGILFKE